MKTIIRVLLLATLMLWVMGVNAQVTSPNGEFSYNYVSEYTLVTGLGDTIHTNHLMPHGINDEGHAYSIQVYNEQEITMYYSAPWIEVNAMFIKFTQHGKFVQSLMFFKEGSRITFAYASDEKCVSGEIIDNKYSKALSLWKN